MIDLDTNNYNVLRGENKARHNALRLAGFISGILTLLCIFLPFSSFQFNEYIVRLTGPLLIGYNIRFGNDLLIRIPAGMRICLVLALLLTAAGLVLLALKKYMYASTAFFLSALCSIIELTFVSEVVKQATRAGLTSSGSMFFTFWGLNILRRSTHVKVRKSLIGKLFGMMMPRGSRKLGLSRMNMGGMGAKMIRGIMKDKNVQSLEDLIQAAMASGVRVLACQMSMDLMGIQQEELIDGVELAGVATFIGSAELSDTNLFI